MKRIIGVILCSFVACATVSHSFADTETVNGITWTYTVSNGKASLGMWSIRGAVPSSTQGAITIPASFGEYPVTSIEDYAFSGCSGLTSVTIPDSVTSIGDEAFSNCGGLMSISVGSGNANYKSINGLLLSKDGKTLIRGVNGNIAIPDGVTGIGSHAFSYCSGLTNVTIPNSVTSIGDYAFERCSGLTNVTIPDSVTNIGSYAFSYCSGLTSVTIPDSVTSIGSYAFYNCSGLTSVTIPDSVKSIEYGAFSGCSGLTSVTIPNSVTSIGSSAFEGCSGLTSITIPDSVTSIGYGAFYGCDDSLFDTATIPGVKLVDGWAVVTTGSLSGNLDLTGVRGIGASVFEGCSGLTSVTIPDSVTGIGDYAFSGCSGLTSVTIGNGVTSIGNSAFSECENLTGVYITDIASWCGISFGSDDYYFGSANPLEYAHDLYLNGSLVTDLVIPDGVSNIAPHAFCGCNLTSVTIPNSVTSVGDCAFSSDADGPGSYIEYNMNLTNVTIGTSVTNVGVRAFYGRRGLSSVSIPSSVARIGNEAFSFCNESLYDITSIPGVELVDGWAVGNSGRLLGHLDLTKVRGIADYAFHGCWAVTSVTMPNGIMRIADGAFYGCESLASVTIPNSVVSIGDCAFESCGGLTSITIPDGVKSVGDHAFHGCSSRLTSITIGKGVTDIGEFAFNASDDCTSGLISVFIPNNVTNIGREAFGEWPNMVNARVPKVLEKMINEKFVFEYCSPDLVIDYYDVQTCDFPLGINDEVDIGLYGYTAQSLPKGLAYSAKTGKLSGTVNNAGVYEATFSKNGERDVMVQIVVRKAYAVTFDANGGMPKTQRVSLFPESSFVLPGDPARVGYAFMGWWTEKIGGAKVTESTTFSEGAYALLYAQWEANRYAVAFDANCGTGAMDVQQMVYDVAVPLFGNGFTLSGSLLRGWATSADGTVAYRDGEKVKNLSEVADDVVTLYAVWQKKPDWVLACEASFGEIGRVSLDGNDNIVVTLMGDVTGTVEIPDNVGAVTIDLNGHSMVGNGGGLGETALPDGPAIRIVKGGGEGGATRLAIVDTSDGEKGRISGGGESAGIEVAEDAATGVRLDVEEGVGVFNGDGSEQELKPMLVGTGKVTVPKTWKVGQKVTWKATADKGSVFARWEGPLVDSLDLTKNERRNPSLAFVVPEGFETNQIKAVFIPLDDDGLYTLGITQTEFELKEAVSDVCVTDDSQSYVTATASGLPTGLKFNAKTLQITGTPTKGGVYWVQVKAKNASGYQWAENVMVTVSGDGKEAKEPQLTRTAYHPLTVICATEGGMASGTGVYAEGKKVTIKATPAKGYVFAGWYDENVKCKMENVKLWMSQAASMNVVVPEMRYVFAKFVTADEDRDSIELAVNGVEMAAGAGRPPYQTNIWAGVYMEWPVAASALSETKVKVVGLPSGLKFTDKPVTSKIGSGKTAVTVTNVPAYTIYGAPTAASKTTTDRKTGEVTVTPSAVKITVTTAGKSSKTYQIDTFVDALPAWAVGTFDGATLDGGRGATALPEEGDGHAGRVTLPCGLVTLTVAANGKISGKVLDADGTWTLSAVSFDGVTGTRDACPCQEPENGSQMSDVGSPVFHATVIGKNGKMAITNEVEVSAEEMAGTRDACPYRGVIAARSASTPSQDSVPVEWAAWQNLWKTEPWKTDAKPFAKASALAIDAGTRDACPYPGTITLKFAASGAVTASGKFVTGQDAKGKDVVYSASCSSVLVPEADAAGTRDACPYRIFLYFPPKDGKFEGYADEMQLVWDGAAFSLSEQ